MSFFDRLFGRQPRVEQVSRIWLSEAEALEAVGVEVGQRLLDDRLIVVTSHFDDRLAEIEEMLRLVSIAFEKVEDRLEGRYADRHVGGSNTATVLLARSDVLVGDQSPAESRNPDRSVSVLMRERHGLEEYDKQVESFAASIPFRTRMCFFDSLDDRLLKVFAGDWVRSVLQQMGMKPGEAIESHMVSKRIQAAQQKIAQRYQHARKSGQLFETWPSTTRTLSDLLDNNAG